MKKIVVSSLIIVIIFITTTANATVWRVNNNDNTADFYDIKAAHDNNQVLAGDTLLVEGSHTNYSGFTCTKKITIIGPGYFLAQNYQGADVLSATIGQIIMDTGSEESSLIGLTFNSSTRVKVNTINIERCYLGAYSYIYLYAVENIRIINCYLTRVDDYYSGTGFSSIYLNNNIITGRMEIAEDCHFLSVKNNIFLGTSYKFNAYHFRNNIVIENDAAMNINSAYIENNIGTNNVFGEVNGNKNVSDINALFVGGESPDAKYELATGSEAVGAGHEGVDCGVFSGDDTYVISGLPPLPIITELDVDDAASVETGLSVKIKIRSN